MVEIRRFGVGRTVDVRRQMRQAAVSASALEFHAYRSIILNSTWAQICQTQPFPRPPT